MENKLPDTEKRPAAVQPPLRLSGKKIKNRSPRKLLLLVTIVNRQKADFYLDILQSVEANLQLSLPAEGTASEDIRNLLGLTNTDKAVLFSIIRADKAGAALELLKEKFSTVRDGKGIAYTIPFDSIIGLLNYRFLTNNRKGSKEDF